jgi:hypothetical protein
MSTFLKTTTNLDHERHTQFQTKADVEGKFSNKNSDHCNLYLSLIGLCFQDNKCLTEFKKTGSLCNK